MRRFALYFVAVMACGVAAFPHWAPAYEAASVAPVGVGVLECAPVRPTTPKSSPSERRKPAAPPRPLAGD